MVGVLLFVDRTLGLRHELFAEILNAFRMEMESRKYEIVLISEEASLWRGSLLGHCKALRLDGVFCLSCDYSAKALKELAAGSIPIVGFEIPYENASNVESKNYEAGKARIPASRASVCAAIATRSLLRRFLRKSLCCNAAFSATTKERSPQKY